jgi:SecD/SecF fusion protein
MQNKTAIQFFTIVLALACIYQLSFTLVTRMVEEDAKEFAAGDTTNTLEKRYLDSIWAQPVFDLLVKEYTYQECKEQEIALGLDLKGGMNVTLEVSVVDLIRSMANYSSDSTFNKAITLAQELQKSSQEDYVTLFGKAFEQIDPNAKLAAIFSTKELQNRIPYSASNDDVLKVIHEEADNAIDRTFNILRTRIDKFGVTQPNIQKMGSGRILVELPGIKEPERARKLLQATAKLEFWETYENSEVYPLMMQADSVLARIIHPELAAADSARQDSATTDSSALVKENTLKLDGDSSVASRSDSDSTDHDLTQKLLGGTDDSASKGKLSTLSSADSFQLQHPLLYTLIYPATEEKDGQQLIRMKGPMVGFVAAKDTAKVMEYLNMPVIRDRIFPREMRFLFGIRGGDKEAKVFELIAIKTPARSSKSPLEGDHVIDARKDFDQMGNTPQVDMTMDAEGAKTWKRLTHDNIGKSIAIVLDNYVYSYPTVQGEIPNGRSQITGIGSIDEANDLANILKAGKLPAPARIVEEAVVGPSLGKESISAGVNSFIIALVLILVFMGLYYSTAGWIADLALFFNVFFIMGVLASIQAVLTLPGIAGIVLTLGMAVDANILIYERIREELSQGKGIKLAISDGFSNAMSSIVDANVTTLITGVILYIFGSGPIQGFATTLIIGILTTLFTAIFISRLVFEWLLNRDRKVAFDNSVTRGAFKNIRIDFVSKRKIYYAISGILVAAGLFSIFSRGFSFGVDFRGGRTYEVGFKNSARADEVRKHLSAAFGSSPEVKEFDRSDRLRITTSYLIDDNSTEADSVVESKLKAGLAKITDNPSEIIRSQKVGPTIADDIKIAAVWAVIFSLVGIFLYILIRFRKWQFSLGAIAALTHDVLLVLGVFSVLHGILPFSMDIDQAFIAAILTVIGFSINDTVVVFDRVREQMRDNPKKGFSQNINDAINATLSRTINTSLTIFFVLLSMFLFGGEVIRGFTFAMLIGIVVGTYSSIGIATPIVIDLEKKNKPE